MNATRENDPPEKTSRFRIEWTITVVDTELEQSYFWRDATPAKAREGLRQFLNEILRAADATQ